MVFALPSHTHEVQIGNRTLERAGCPLVRVRSRRSPAAVLQDFIKKVSSHGHVIRRTLCVVCSLEASPARGLILHPAAMPE